MTQNLVWQGEKPPAFLLFVNDFLGDALVEVMTARQVGAYLLLLLRAWHQTPVGSIPADERTLVRWSRLSDSEWAEDRQAILACWRRSGDLYFQKRLQAEAERHLSRRQKASAAAGKRWNRSGDPDGADARCDRNANALPTHKSSIAGSIAASNAVKSSQVKLSQEDKTKESLSPAVAGSSAGGRLFENGSPESETADGQGRPLACARTRGNDPDEPKHGKTEKTPYTSNFEAFWISFPSIRKTSKRTAWQAWQRALRRGAVSGDLIAAAKEYADSPLGRSKFAAGPAPWLNGNRWEDDRASWQRGDDSAAGFQQHEEYGKGF